MGHYSADRHMEMPNTIGLMMAAAAAGALTALLLAPKRGTELREDMRMRAHLQQEKMSQGVETMRTKAQDCR
jgi:gas vesicle protein